MSEEDFVLQEEEEEDDEEEKGFALQEEEENDDGEKEDSDLQEEEEEEGTDKLELQSLPDMEEYLGQPQATRTSTESTQLELDDLAVSKSRLNMNDIPEDGTLRPLNLQTDPNEDDFAKHLVRIGRLGVEDVLEIVDADGYIVGSKVLPHAESRYLEELALEESARRLDASGLSSDYLVHGILQYGSGTSDLFGDMYSREYLGEGEEESGEVSGSASDDSIGAGGPLRNPKTVESVYDLIEPGREDEFNTQIEHLNRQIAHIQHDICLEHKQRQALKNKRFEFEKNIILEAVSEAGILYLPGNFLHPIIGRRINDKDVSFILETVKEIPEAEFKGFNLAYNQITDEGITAISQFVQERPAVVHLNLSHNDFTAAGLHTLVTYLMNRVSLQSLKITGVKVGDEGIDSITCLYMCGKGPRDIDLSETDMCMPGFQALCSALQAVDEDEDYPKFLTKHKLPFSLDTLARLKVENHEYLKAQTYTHLCHSHFELVPAEKTKPLEEANAAWNENDSKAAVKPTKSRLDDEITKVIKDDFDTTLGAGEDDSDDDDEKPAALDFRDEVVQSVRIEEKTRTMQPTVEEFISEHKMLKKSGCRATRPDGRPVIVCPSLYSLEIDEFIDDEGTTVHNDQREATPLRVNPMFMDTLVNPEVDEEEAQKFQDKDVADTHTAQKATVSFVRDAFKEAGAAVGTSEYTEDSDMTQLLLATILENAKNFLQADAPVPGVDTSELSEDELKMIWEHSLKTTSKIFKPAIPDHCTITEDVMDVFVGEFLKISTGMFYKLIQVPFFQDLFERAATKGCVDATKAREMKELDNYEASPFSDMSYNKIVQDIIIKFLEGVIVRSAQIIGGGDPYNIRHQLGGQSNNEYVTKDEWPSIVDITEEMVEPLVDKFFEAGGVLAQDAIAYKEQNDLAEEHGIEPAKLYMEGVFKQLTDFLYQVKEDDEKLKERMDKPAKKFTFSTKPVRIVMNRPIFRGYEPVMASKLAAFLRTNDSLQCLHLRKWDLGEDGMINLMEGLLLNMNLVTIDLASNAIGAEGMRPLGLYLRRNQNLKHLLLNHNRLRNPGIQELTNSIAESSLVSLNVAYNDISEAGLYPFLEAVRESSIYSLYLLGNYFTQPSTNLLRDLFESKSLRQEECDLEIQEIDGEAQLARNSLARDINEWYEVPADVDVGLVCPPFYMELYKPPKVTIFGAVDVEL